MEMAGKDFFSPSVCGPNARYFVVAYVPGPGTENGENVSSSPSSAARRRRRLCERRRVCPRSESGGGADARWKSNRSALPNPTEGDDRFSESTIGPNCERCMLAGAADEEKAPARG
jgi:hypothetical protein